MKIVKRSARAGPQVSLVLLDWGVRESFQLLHYLGRQTAGRETFEVVVVEYYGRESPALAPFHGAVDTWALLEMPSASYYHKHLMYNAGIVLARGEVVVFCDSDAMVRETFISSITTAFRSDVRMVLHLDQFRNARRDLYPFSYPSFEEVLGPGCINNAGGRPRGLVALDDPLHERNYGACMAARREDLIAVGGADEHVDYLGHICGPYEMTFRLGNLGLRERWHPTEYLYHTWHPGQAGEGNYMGPHDGRHMSTTALDALATGRTGPLVENPAIALLRTGQPVDAPALEQHLIAPDRADRWASGRLGDCPPRLATETQVSFDYHGFRVERREGVYVGHLIMEMGNGADGCSISLVSESPEGIRREIESAVRGVLGLMNYAGWVCVLLSRANAGGRVTVRRALTGDARIRRNIRTIPPRMVNRLCQLLNECSELSASLGSLLVNLYFSRGKAQGDTEPIVILVHGRVLRMYLRGLSAVGLLPRLHVISPRNRRELEARVGDLYQRGRRRRVIVARDLYFKHHSLFSIAASSHVFQVL
jgi:hypothetical protein